jgi:endoglucanase
MKWRFILLLLLVSFSCSRSKVEKVIKINQIGYHTYSMKVAIVPKTRDKEFFIRDIITGKEVYRGELSKASKWEYAKECVRKADFSDLYMPGIYQLVVEGEQVKKSYLFTIHDTIYATLSHNAIKAFYHARASMSILEEYAGKFHRTMGHPDTTVLVHKSAACDVRNEGDIISSPGGWYDAADYNKYIVNSGITTFTLLHMYELFPDYFKGKNLYIPESDNNIPDLLDEILWNLRWMITMQNPNDGSVYHKLTNKEFDEFIAPDEARKARYVVGRTTSAALNLAAVCAKASRIFDMYESELPGFSDSCMVVAQKAISWASKHPEEYYIQPEDIETGAYDDFDLEDEFLWAYMELYLATGNTDYLLTDLVKKHNYSVPAWGYTGTLGLYSLFSQSILKVSDQKELKKNFLFKAEELFDNYFESPYNTCIDTFEWGSNSYAANQGIFLLHAYSLTHDQRYFDAAESALNYILGTNATGYSFVTGFGSFYPVDIHDRRAASLNPNKHIPGYLVGGPTNTEQNDCGEEIYATKLPALSYIDKRCSYSTNEIAINWQAALALLSNYIYLEKINKSLSDYQE